MSPYKNTLQFEIRGFSEIRETIEKINVTLDWLVAEKTGENLDNVDKHYELGLAFKDSNDLIAFLNWLGLITNFRIIDLKVTPDLD
jgi:hypothetical protein